jgi:ribosome biogenesis protein Nip4
MVKPIRDFLNRLNGTANLDETLIVRRSNRYFLLSANLKKLIHKDFFYAGTYLGKIKNGEFFPSFGLLKILAETEANRIIVDKRTEWLFICGRDIFRRGITRVLGSLKKGDYTLVLNRDGECLGFGRLIRDIGDKNGRVVVKNISDIGDFLRRET